MKIKEFLSLLNPLKGIIQKNQKIQNTDQLIVFIKERSAWITQVTLLGYLKTRMGTQYVKASGMVQLMVLQKTLLILLVILFSLEMEQIVAL